VDSIGFYWIWGIWIKPCVFVIKGPTWCVLGFLWVLVIRLNTSSYCPHLINVQSVQLHRFKSFKKLTVIQYFIISGTRNYNWIAFGVGFSVSFRWVCPVKFAGWFFDMSPVSQPLVVLRYYLSRNFFGDHSVFSCSFRCLQHSCYLLNTACIFRLLAVG